MLEQIKERGKLIDTTLEGTSQLWELDNIEYVVLCDNTVITREEDNQNDPVFPL